MMSNVQRVQSFAPLASPDAVVLILGSMPGVASLRQQQYYAHPKNLFWDFMGEMFDAGRECPYAERLRRLAAHGLALWDVAHRCVRPGSLDAAIDTASVEPNDFTMLFRCCPHIRHIFFNGRKAAELYRRLVLPALPEDVRQIERSTLPSTSPANAAIPVAVRRHRWLAVRQALKPACP